VKVNRYVLGLLLLSAAAVACENQSMTPSIQDIKQQRQATLLSLPGVVSVGIGQDDKGRSCIVVGLDHPQPDTEAEVHRILGDTPVVVRVVGTIKPIKP
jgi:hypothetical protein